MRPLPRRQCGLRAHVLQRGRVLAVPRGCPQACLRLRAFNLGVDPRAARLPPSPHLRGSLQDRPAGRIGQHARDGVVAAPRAGGHRRGRRRPRVQTRPQVVRGRQEEGQG